MDQLIDTIRAATASDASTDQKAAGVAACRTIIAALDTEPGKPLRIPGAPMHATPRVSIDQVLDLMIAKLTMIATERELKPSLGTPATAESANTAPAAAITTTAPMVPHGLRVPLAGDSALKAATRPGRTVPRRKP